MSIVLPSTVSPSDVVSSASYDAEGGASVTVHTFASGVTVSVPTVGATTVVFPSGATTERYVLHVLRSHVRACGVAGNYISGAEDSDGSRVFRVGFADMTALKQANVAHGHFWFSNSTSSFFRSQYGRTLYGGVYFVTSDVRDGYDGQGDRRIFRVCVASPSGAVDWVDSDAEFSTGEAARREAKRLASLLPAHAVKRITLPVPSA